MQKCAIEMALDEISQNELSYINKEKFNDFYRILYGSGDVKRICQKLDDFIDDNVQGDRLKIKQKILFKIADEFRQYFLEVSDLGKQCLFEVSVFEKGLMIHFYVFKNFLKGLRFNTQKDLLLECFDLAFNNSPLVFTNTFRDFCGSFIAHSNNFDELSSTVPFFLTSMPYKDYLQRMQTLTQLLRDVKHFLLKKALHERGFINLQSGENLSYFVHFTDEENLFSIFKNGILSRKEIEKRGIASKTNDEMRLDGALDYISISITHPNDIVLKNFINKGSIKKPIYICLDPFSVLSRYGLWDIIFCDKNAAASACEKGNSWLDFENIFAPSKEYQTTTNFFNYNRQGKEKYEPTDPQAEILVQNCIPKNAIAFILDSNGKCIFERKR